jgi:hypothetical protein
MFLKERLARESGVLHGVLGTIPSAVAAQAVAAAGADSCSSIASTRRSGARRCTP